MPAIVRALSFLEPEMERLALTLKVGQQLILPSGRAAQVLELRADVVRFRYLDKPGEVDLSRRALIAAGFGA